MISIILTEPENPGNVGAIARVMKNFGFFDLVLLNPKCEHLCAEAKCRAKHAQDVLKNAQVVEEMPAFDSLIGTTAIMGTDYNIPRSPLTPRQLAQKVGGIDTSMGLWIGREGPGLSNEEIRKCDFVVSIPADPGYPTLNISHAVGILLYELFQEMSVPSSISQIEPASKRDKDQVLKMIDDIASELTFTTEEKKETQDKVWKRVVGKALLTKREAFAMMGFLRKIKESFK